ncbi:hypothetical protein MKX03_006409 [Papaver bracteatum]|nr:hypothetical protein MKX03_006409 [Papaver bracteatum]
MDENIDPKPLIIKEIIQARELLKELQSQLNPSSILGHDLITKILCSVETSLSMIEQVKMENESTPNSSKVHISTGSPLSDSNSISSQAELSSNLHICLITYIRAVVRWTEQVRASSETGLEGPLHDGYNWKKYGQKDIRGAKYPRGYFKCHHRRTQGCLAMKQVQRSELDSSNFNVTYIGKHNCNETSVLLSEQYSTNKQELFCKRRHWPNYHEEPGEDKSFDETYINFQTSSVQVSKDKDKQFKSFPSFSIYSTTSGSKENHFYPSSVRLKTHSPSPSLSPTFISTPTTSESNYKMNNIEDYNICEHLIQTTADSHDGKSQMVTSPSTVSATSSSKKSYLNQMDSSWDWDFPIDYSHPQF